MTDTIEVIGFFFLVLLFCGLCFEIGMMVYFYNNSDNVECNFLWCEFTKERHMQESYFIQNSTIIVSQSRECFLNGAPVNCSEIIT